MHKIVSGYAPSNLKLNFHSNQNRHSHKLIVRRPRLDLFKCSLMYSGENLWNNLPLSIKIWQITKQFFKHSTVFNGKNHNKHWLRICALFLLFLTWSHSFIVSIFVNMMCQICILCIHARYAFYSLSLSIVNMIFLSL